MKFVVGIQVTRTYNLTVEAENNIEAEEKASALDTLQIADRGSLKDVEVTYLEVIGIE